MDPECSMDTAVTPANGPLVVAFADDLTPMPQPDVGLMPFVPDVVPPQPDQSHFVVHRVPFNKDNVIHFTLPPQYTDVVQISSGTYGMVARAIDRAHVNPETGEPLVVAIKKIRQPWGSEAEARHAYRELRLLRYLQQSWPDSCARINMDATGTIQHENIIALLDCFIAWSPNGEEDMYLVMEHGGADLQSVSHLQTLSLEHVKFIGYQILRAFLYLHSAGIIHRDLKPSNIACSDKCDIKILDFGLSRIESDSNSRMTGYVATRYYRAPEVIMQWGKYSTSLDMWSFGCVLGELLLRDGSRNLFRGDDYVNQLVQIAKLIGMPSEDHIAKIDGNAEKWVRTALAGMVRRPFADLPQFRGPSNETPDAEAMDLLERLLQYDPDVRPTAEEALRHPFFSEYHVPTDEPIAAQPFDKAFEKLKLDAAGWKEMCMREIAEFRRNPPKF
eukprot:m.191359 g.191359  ORF g.191359 m.191359 type:complete len:445 (+) comp18589_c0_seq8:241-1575(+)